MTALTTNAAADSRCQSCGAERPGIAERQRGSRLRSPFASRILSLNPQPRKATP